MGSPGHHFIWCNIRGQSSHISSISLEVGLLTQADQQMAVGAAPVAFGVPPVDDICGHNGTAGDLHGVFVVAAGTACYDGVVDATGAAGAAGGLAANNAGEASGVAGATTGVVDVSCLTASG